MVHQAPTYHRKDNFKHHNTRTVQGCQPLENHHCNTNLSDTDRVAILGDDDYHGFQNRISWCISVTSLPCQTMFSMECHLPSRISQYLPKLRCHLPTSFFDGHADFKNLEQSTLINATHLDQTTDRQLVSDHVEALCSDNWIQNIAFNRYLQPTVNY